jgi:hypothetical protein
MLLEYVVDAWSYIHSFDANQLISLEPFLALCPLLSKFIELAGLKVGYVGPKMLCPCSLCMVLLCTIRWLHCCRLGGTRDRRRHVSRTSDTNDNFVSEFFEPN